VLCFIEPGNPAVSFLDQYLIVKQIANKLPIAYATRFSLQVLCEPQEWKTITDASFDRSVLLVELMMLGLLDSASFVVWTKYLDQNHTASE
jgi:hypothetical protein